MLGGNTSARRRGLKCIILLLAGGLTASPAGIRISLGRGVAPAIVRPELWEPVPFFVANHGQASPEIRYTITQPGLKGYFGPSEILLDLGGATIGLRFAGANRTPRIQGLKELAGRVNFLMGSEPQEWATDLSAYQRIVYREIYPGIDMIYSAFRRQIKSEFVVAPGADPSVIRLSYRAAQRPRLDGKGGLVLKTPSGQLTESAPEIYQEIGGRRVRVEGGFRLFPNGNVGFQVGSFDRAGPLTIDPAISYSTFLGGSRFDAATAVTTDSAGNAYVTGWTESSDFPTSNPAQAGSGGAVDVFVAKFNASGALVYSTYIGGRGDDRGFGIAVDGAGNAYVTGWTGSSNFPTAAPLQAVLRGGKNAFILKLTPAGNALVYSTYLGGSGSDSGNGIAIDSSGSAYITGQTDSLNFPTLNCVQCSYGGAQDSFVAKLSSAGNALVYATYLGGSGGDRGNGIAVDGAGAAYVTGGTTSLNFPMAGALQSANGGGQDAFVAKLSAAGTSLVYSTYLGGAGGTVGFNEEGRGIAVDASGNAYVTGATSSANFPVVNAFQPSYAGGGQDAFVSKLNATGGALLYSTFLGGKGLDVGNGISVDSEGNAVVTGYTFSTDFPVTNPVQSNNAGLYDAFLVQFNAAGTALLSGTYLGGNGSDSGNAVAMDSRGRAYVAGQTLSTNLPLKSAVQTVNGGEFGGFLTTVATKPFCTSVGPQGVVTYATSGALDFYAYGVLNATAVYFAAWSDVNWQDDLVWYPGVDLGGGTWKGSINLANHRPGSPDYGAFLVHAWMEGNPNTICGGTNFTRVPPPPPCCTSVGPQGVVTSATSGTLDFYAYGVLNATAVYFAAWSDVNGQDDLVWYPGVNQGGGTWKGSVNLANHRPGNPDYGAFLVHAWMEGNPSTICSGITFTRVPPPPPSCTSIGPQGVVTYATSGTLDFYAYGVLNATAVYFPTWSDVNGQDDLIWYPGVNLGGGTWRGSVNLANHRPGNPDYGAFLVHVWMDGNPSTICGGLTFTRP